MNAAWLYEGALCAAFWVALARFRAAPGAAVHAGRFVLGLALAAAAARTGGLLCVPLALVLAAPWRAGPRAAFLGAALPALPPAFAVAKLGCITAGCCEAALAEAFAFAAVGLGLSRLPPRLRASAALAGIGAVRFAVLPLRPGAEVSAWLAALWLLAGALRCSPFLQEAACPRPGSATSKRTGRSSRPGCAGSSAARATWS